MLAVEERYLPITLYAPGLTDDGFNEFCQLYAAFDVQYSADGNLIIMPPSDPITGLRHSEVNFQLRKWARSRRLGGVTDGGSALRYPVERGWRLTWLGLRRANYALRQPAPSL